MLAPRRPISYRYLYMICVGAVFSVPLSSMLLSA